MKRDQAIDILNQYRDVFADDSKDLFVDSTINATSLIISQPHEKLSSLGVRVGQQDATPPHIPVREIKQT